MSFAKFEPNPMRKIVEHRERVVYNLDVVDQLVERMLVGKMLSEIKKEFPNNIEAVGIGFTDEMSKEFCQNVISVLGAYGGRRVSSDIKGWDASIGRDSICHAFKLITHRLDKIKYKRYIRAIDRLALMITNPLLVLPESGNKTGFYVRENPGGMLSGSVLTTVGNGAARATNARLAGSLRAVVAGDDCIEVTSGTAEELTNKYKSLGLTMRSVEFLPDNELNFCSHNFIGPEFKPALDSISKTLHRHFTKKTDYSQRYAILWEFRHHARIKDITYLVDNFSHDVGAAV